MSAPQASDVSTRVGGGGGAQVGNASAWATAPERRTRRSAIARAAHGLATDMAPLHDWARFLRRAVAAARAAGSSCTAVEAQ